MSKLDILIIPDQRLKTVAEPVASYKNTIADMTPAERDKELKRLEEQMFQHAKNLEFEEAARLRDWFVAVDVADGQPGEPGDYY